MYVDKYKTSVYYGFLLHYCLAAKRRYYLKCGECGGGWGFKPALY